MQIQIKRSSISGVIPQASGLLTGELAVNTADGILWTKHSDGTLKLLAGSGFVPYSGSVQDVNLGSNNLRAKNITSLPNLTYPSGQIRLESNASGLNTTAQPNIGFYHYTDSSLKANIGLDNSGRIQIQASQQPGVGTVLRLSPSASQADLLSQTGSSYASLNLLNLTSNGNIYQGNNSGTTNVQSGYTGFGIGAKSAQNMGAAFVTDSLDNVRIEYGLGSGKTLSLGSYGLRLSAAGAYSINAGSTLTNVIKTVGGAIFGSTTDDGISTVQIYPQSGVARGLLVKGFASQSGNYIEAQTTSGVSEFSVVPGAQMFVGGALDSNFTVGISGTRSNTLSLRNTSGPTVGLYWAGNDRYGMMVLNGEDVQLNGPSRPRFSTMGSTFDGAVADFGAYNSNGTTTYFGLYKKNNTPGFMQVKVSSSGWATTEALAFSPQAAIVQSDGNIGANGPSIIGPFAGYGIGFNSNGEIVSLINSTARARIGTNIAIGNTGFFGITGGHAGTNNGSDITLSRFDLTTWQMGSGNIANASGNLILRNIVSSGTIFAHGGSILGPGSASLTIAGQGNASVIVSAAGNQTLQLNASNAHTMITRTAGHGTTGSYLDVLQVWSDSNVVKFTNSATSSTNQTSEMWLNGNFIKNAAIRAGFGVSNNQAGCNLLIQAGTGSSVGTNTGGNLDLQCGGGTGGAANGLVRILNPNNSGVVMTIGPSGNIVNNGSIVMNSGDSGIIAAGNLRVWSSTGASFIVRNSTNTTTLFNVNGDGTATINNSGPKLIGNVGGTGRLTIQHNDGNNMAYFGGDGTYGTHIRYLGLTNNPGVTNANTFITELSSGVARVGTSSSNSSGSIKASGLFGNTFKASGTYYPTNWGMINIFNEGTIDEYVFLGITNTSSSGGFVDNQLLFGSEDGFSVGFDGFTTRLSINPVSDIDMQAPSGYFINLYSSEGIRIRNVNNGYGDLSVGSVSVATYLDVLGTFRSRYELLSSHPTIASGIFQVYRNTTTGEIRLWAGDGSSKYTCLTKAGETVSTPSATTQTISLNEESKHRTLDLSSSTGNVTVTLNVPDYGGTAGTILIKQHGTTPRNITWAVNTGSIKWLGTQPTWSSDAASSYRVVSWRYNGSLLFLSSTDSGV